MRLIDADALIEDVRKNSVSYFADDFAREWVDKQPTVMPSAQPEILACGEGELNVPDTNVADCSDCIKHGGDWDCDHVHCHKGKSAQPDNDMIHLQKEQAYLQGWEEGRKALREEIWEDGRDRLD